MLSSNFHLRQYLQSKTCDIVLNLWHIFSKPFRKMKQLYFHLHQQKTLFPGNYCFPNKKKTKDAAENKIYQG